jgi:hypothetical protein
MYDEIVNAFEVGVHGIDVDANKLTQVIHDMSMNVFINLTEKQREALTGGDIHIELIPLFHTANNIDFKVNMQVTPRKLEELIMEYMEVALGD